jgi:hypothetical protein
MNKPFFNKSIIAASLAFLLIISCVPAVSAFDLIFEDGSIAGPQKVTLTVIGVGTINETYNTTSTITGLDPNSSYVVRISPMAGADYVRNPQAFLDDLVPYVSDNLIVLVVGCFVIGALAIGGRKR